MDQGNDVGSIRLKVALSQSNVIRTSDWASPSNLATVRFVAVSKLRKTLLRVEFSPSATKYPPMRAFSRSGVLAVERS